MKSSASKNKPAARHNDGPPAGALFQFNGKASLRQVAPLGLQHLVAAIVGIVTPAMIIAQQCAFSPEDTTRLIQMSLVVSAIGTLVQIFPIFRLGSRLPVIMGISFAYLPTMQAIAGDWITLHPNQPQAAISVILGAQIFGGLAAFLVGLFIKQVRRFFPPLVTGTVIFTIGLSLYPTAVRYMAGGGAPPVYDEVTGALLSGNVYFGSWHNWLIAAVTLLIVIFFNYFTKGFAKLASILLGMAGGYLLALIFTVTGVCPLVSFQNVGSAGWFSFVPPGHFGIRFVPSAIVSMVIMYVVNAVQAIGDFSSTTLGGMDRNPTNKELSGGIMANGIVSAVGALFGGLPSATYSQNVGIVTLTRVINRMVFAFAAVAMLIAGLIPKFSAMLTTIPQCVIGGATLSVFASITMTGIRMIASAGMSQRNFGVVGISVSLGVGVTSVAGALGGFPSWVSSVFGSSSVVIATLAAIVLNLVLPAELEEEPIAQSGDEQETIPDEE
ncbi:purine permease [Ruminococcaceae bacterium OttesenSCG-928-O06]|nr:purine permease [Ruminococcaceae bacterium OttesenSCG-928-O06]